MELETLFECRDKKKAFRFPSVRSSEYRKPDGISILDDTPDSVCNHHLCGDPELFRTLANGSLQILYNNSHSQYTQQVL